MDTATLAGQLATPAVTEEIAGRLGVPPATLTVGLGTAIPAVLAALAAVARRPGAADRLAAAVAGAAAPGAATRGGLVEPLLGAETTAAIERALAARTGLPRDGANALLGLAGAVALQALGQGSDGSGAGALRRLEQERAAIAAALPPDLAAAVAPPPQFGPAAAPRPGTAKLEPEPPAATPWWRWALTAVAVALAAWLLLRLLAPAPAPAPVVPAPPPPVAAPTAPADALVVGGTDVGAAVSGALQTIGGSFAGITDAASAQAALPGLLKARDGLDDLESAVSALPLAGHAALEQMVSAALPQIRDNAERLKTDGPISAIVGPVVDDILARLTAFAA